MHCAIVDTYPEDVQNGKVLLLVWQDSNKVGFCSTIHDGTEWVVRIRKRPKGSSTSASITKQPFAIFEPLYGCKDAYVHTRLLPIPGMVDDYNHYMGGVDIANQLRSKFSTQQRGVKPWRPLFYWLLDTTIINAFLISENQRKAKLKLDEKDKVRSAHRTFRESLVTALLLDIRIPKADPKYITKNTRLPAIRLTRLIEIHFPRPIKRANCIFCRWSQHNKKAKSMQGISKTPGILKTRTNCNHCSVPLCGKCFYLFHYFVD